MLNISGTFPLILIGMISNNNFVKLDRLETLKAIIQLVYVNHADEGRVNQNISVKGFCMIICALI